MEKRLLGGTLEVSRIGLGCMGMSQSYGTGDDARSVEVIHRALDLGITFFDTADVYGAGQNEALVGRALAGRRSRAVLATKFGNERDPGGNRLGVNGRPDYVRKACEASLRRLGTEIIDLYYQHRVDPKVPIEETVGAMSRLVEDGKIRFLGLSEAAPETIRRAHATYPITALQTEHSLWSRDPEEELLPLCRELGIGFVPYAPLGRGFLTGRLRTPDDLSEGDSRKRAPRFSPENFAENLRLVRAAEGIAARKGVTPAQLALAWVLAKGEEIVPIPGTKRMRYLEENVGALEVTLDAEDLGELDEAFPKDAAAGERYSEAGMRNLNL